MNFKDYQVCKRLAEDERKVTLLDYANEARMKQLGLTAKDYALSSLAMLLKNGQVKMESHNFETFYLDDVRSLVLAALQGICKELNSNAIKVTDSELEKILDIDVGYPIDRSLVSDFNLGLIASSSPYEASRLILAGLFAFQRETSACNDFSIDNPKTYLTGLLMNIKMFEPYLSILEPILYFLDIKVDRNELAKTLKFSQNLLMVSYYENGLANIDILKKVVREKLKHNISKVTPFVGFDAFCDKVAQDISGYMPDCIKFTEEIRKDSEFSPEARVLKAIYGI